MTTYNLPQLAHEPILVAIPANMKNITVKIRYNTVCYNRVLYIMWQLQVHN